MSQWLASKAYALGRWLEGRAAAHETPPAPQVGAAPSEPPLQIAPAARQVAPPVPVISAPPQVLAQGDMKTPAVAPTGRETQSAAHLMPAELEPPPAPAAGPAVLGTPSTPPLVPPAPEDVPGPTVVPAVQELPTPQLISTAERRPPVAEADSVAMGAPFAPQITVAPNVSRSQVPFVAYGPAQSALAIASRAANAALFAGGAHRILSPTSTFPSAANLVPGAAMPPRPVGASAPAAHSLHQWPLQGVTATGSMHQWPSQGVTATGSVHQYP